MSQQNSCGEPLQWEILQKKLNETAGTYVYNTYYPYGYPQPSRCPGCGRCQYCGRPSPWQPWIVWTNGTGG